MDVLRHIIRALWWCIRTPIVWWLGGRADGRRRGGTHGSARWSTRIEQIWYGAVRGEGIVLGRGAFGRLVRFSTDGIVMVFASTGAGKGLGVVIPSLLSYRGSMVVTDPKGENYAITRRRRADFGKVYMLSPTNIMASARFNPLDIVRPGDSAVDDAHALAALMVFPDGERDAHWDKKAISLLKAMILHTLHQPPASRTLASVRRLSVGAPQTFIDSLRDIGANSPSMAAREIITGALTASSTSKDALFTDEMSSILSTLQKATEPWSETAPAGKLSASSTFRLADLTENVATLYLCVDEDVLDVYGPWLRVMVGCILKTLTRAKQNPPKRKVVLMLDEVAVLGRLDTLQRQAGLLRAYCTPVLIWQNLPQVNGVYGQQAEAFLATASARVFFGVNDNLTADYAATMIGPATSWSASRGESLSDRGQNSQRSASESGYPLLDPAEIQSLPLTRAIIRMRHVRYPILARRIDYRKVWRWLGYWDSWRGQQQRELDNEPIESLDEPYSGPLPGRLAASDTMRAPAV